MNVDATLRSMIASFPDMYPNRGAALALLLHGASGVSWKDGDIVVDDGTEEYRQTNPLNLNVEDEYVKQVEEYVVYHRHILWLCERDGENAKPFDLEDGSLAYCPLTPSRHAKLMKRATETVERNQAAAQDMDTLMADNGPHPVLITSIQVFNTPMANIPDNANADWLTAIEDFCILILTADYSRAFEFDEKMHQVPMSENPSVRGRESVIAPEPESLEFYRWERDHSQIFENLDFAQQVLERVTQVRATA